MGRARAVVAAGAVAVFVTPHEGADGLSVQGDRGRFGAHGLVDETGVSVERARDVFLRGPRFGHVRHRAGELRLVGDALTNTGAVVKRERKVRQPVEAAVDAANGQDRSGREVRGLPGALDGDLTRGLT